MAYGESGSAPLLAIRDEVLELHEAITDEESRLGLMRIFNLVCDMVAVHLQEKHGNVEAFAQHSQRQKRTAEARVGKGRGRQGNNRESAFTSKKNNNRRQ